MQKVGEKASIDHYINMLVHSKTQSTANIILTLEAEGIERA